MFHAVPYLTKCLLVTAVLARVSFGAWNLFPQSEYLDKYYILKALWNALLNETELRER